jgi:hypothetical protein
MLEKQSWFACATQLVAIITNLAAADFTADLRRLPLIKNQNPDTAGAAVPHERGRCTELRFSFDYEGAYSPHHARFMAGIAANTAGNIRRICGECTSMSQPGTKRRCWRQQRLDWPCSFQRCFFWGFRLGCWRSRPFCRSLICFLISCARFRAAKKTSSGSLRWSSHSRSILPKRADSSCSKS